jgi:hypothetical protein
MITWSGKRIFPKGNKYHVPNEAPTIEDIAVGLSRQSRFAGQVDEFFSVLSHVLCCWTNTQSGKLGVDILLHDSAEAIMGDVPTTWKPEAFSNLEAQIIENLYKAEGLEWPIPENRLKLIKKIDYIHLVAEAHLLGHRAAKEFWPLDQFESSLDKEMLEMAFVSTKQNIDSNQSLLFLAEPYKAIDEFSLAFDVSRSIGFCKTSLRP